jgi:beta-lactamase class C
MPKIAHQFMQRNQAPGVAFVIYDKGDIYHFNYGVMDRQTHQPIDNETLFEIGSVTKAFTGSLLAMAITQGTVQLSQSIKPYLPISLQAKGVAVNQLTFQQLATHTSELPKNPQNYQRNKPYLQQQFWAYLKHWHPVYSPGKRCRYSNLGFGLLGKVLAMRYGEPFDVLLRRELLSPLDMYHTTLSSHDEKHYATGYTKNNQQALRWSMTAWRPSAGALRSTPRDMAQFLKASMHGPQTPMAISQAMTVAQTAYFAKPNGEKVGLGFETMPCALGHLCWGKGGTTSGFSAFILSDPEAKRGIVVLTNKTGIRLRKVALAILKRLSH